MNKNTVKNLSFLISFLFTLISLFTFIEQLKIPIFEGQKFGSYILEKKLQKLIEMENSKGIDAIFFGASTVDFGISAKTFSEEVTKATGKKFIAFNFGMGGGDHFIWADFLKLIKLYSKPKIFFAQNTIGFLGKLEGFPKGGLHEMFTNSPVGSLLDFGIGLKFISKLWDISPLSYFPNIRSKIIFDYYVFNTTSYPINEYGDSISYNHIYLNEESKLVDKAKENFINEAVYTIYNLPITTDSKEYDLYFNSGNTDSSLNIGYRRLIKEVETLNGKVYISAFPISSIESTFEVNELFKKMNRRYSFFYEELSKKLNVMLLNSLEDVSLETWQVQDETHYNIYGAEKIGRRLAEKFLNQKLQDIPKPNIDALFQIEKENRMGKWTSIIRSPNAIDKNVLKLRYLQNENIYKIPKSKSLNLIIRLEKNTSRIFILEKTDENTFRVIIPKKLLKENAFYAIDLLSHQNLSYGIPLETYTWEKK